MRPDLVHLNGYAHGGALPGVPSVVVGPFLRRCPGGTRCAARPLPPTGSAYRSAVATGLRAADASWSRRPRPCCDALAAHYGRAATRRSWSTMARTSRRASAPRREGAARPDRRPAVGRGQERGCARSTRAATAAVAGAGSPATDRRPERRARACTMRSSTRRCSAARSARAGWRRASVFVSPALYEPFGLVGARGRAARAARWCSATSRASASSGTAPRCSSRRDDRRRAARVRSTRLIDDPRRWPTLGARARERAQRASR